LVAKDKQGLGSADQADFAEETAELVHRRVRVIAGLGTVIFATFIGLRFHFAPEDVESTLEIRVICVSLSLFFLWAIHVNSLRWATNWISALLFATWVWYLEALIVAGDAAEPRQFHALMMMAPMWAMLIPMKARQCLVLVVICVVGHWIGFTLAEQLTDFVQLADELAMLTAGGIVAMIATSITRKLRVANFEARREIEKEKERSESLLMHMLPEAIAIRLKDSERGIADAFEGVSILFADVCDFTQLASELSPKELVRFLNRFFSMADELASNEGLEKIKTIGDSYMVASGLPQERHDHAKAIARFALKLRTEFAKLEPVNGRKLELRMGINSGPVVAGVIGRTKFSYDLWGDTVNVAARMESAGQPSVIALPEAIALQLEGDFEVRRLKEVDIKGKGKMSIWKLVGERSSTSP
jgi:class 3 adenylate cyclase